MKRVLKIIALGVLIGIFMLVIQFTLQIPKDTFMFYYKIFGAVVIFGAVLFNYIYIHAFQKKMKKAAVVLEKGKPQEYIELVEGMRQRAKGRFLKHVIDVNLSAGYFKLQDYEKSIALLEGLLGQRLYGGLKMVQRLNLCAAYFYSGQTEKALALYEDSQKTLKPYRKSTLYGGNIMVLDIFAQIEQGALALAGETLTIAKEAYSTPSLQEDYNFLEAKLQQLQNGHS